MISTSHPLCRDGSTTAITWCGVMAIVLVMMHISSLSPTPDCICDPHDVEGWKYSQFIGDYFHDCIYTPREYLSLVLGVFSIIGWFALFLPTLIHNYRTKTANQLTWMWIVIWICGDAENLWACCMTRNLQTLFKVFDDPSSSSSSMYLFPFLLPILVFFLTILSTTHTPFSQTPSIPHYLSLMIYIGLYFIAADLVMLMQWLYYHHVYPRMYGVEYPQAEVVIDKETECNTTPTSKSKSKSSSIPPSRHSSSETSPIFSSHASLLSYDSTAVGETNFSLTTHDPMRIYQPSRHMEMHKTTPPPPRRIKVGLKAYTQQVKMERKLSATKQGGVRMMVLMAFVIMGIHQFLMPSDMQQHAAHVSSLDHHHAPSTGRVLLSVEPDPAQVHPVSTSTSTSTSPPLCNSPPILTRGQLFATFLMSWCCSLLYLYSRIPAIRRHYEQQQVPNISMYVMTWAIIANTCYGLCLVLRLPPIDSHVFWYTMLPYVCAALGTALLDVIIVIQFYYYRCLPPSPSPSSLKLVSDAAGWQSISVSTSQDERSLIV